MVVIELLNYYIYLVSVEGTKTKPGSRPCHPWFKGRKTFLVNQNNKELVYLASIN